MAHRPGIQPRKFSHPMLTAEDTAPTVAFLIDVLGFRLSDDVGDGTLVFTRCNPDHHGVGVGRGPRSGLNHYAWEVASLAAIGELGDVLDRNGGRFIWGPGRHGAGRNSHSYHFDPAGAIVEYCAEMYRVWDEAGYEPGRWSLEDPRFANMWGPGPPIEMMETATPQVLAVLVDIDAQAVGEPGRVAVDDRQRGDNLRVAVGVGVADVELEDRVGAGLPAVDDRVRHRVLGVTGCERVAHRSASRAPAGAKRSAARCPR